jgi:hypothetical protein
MTVIPFPLKKPNVPSVFYICLKLPIVPNPLYSEDAVYYKILSLSKGLVADLEMAPEIAPVKRCPKFTLAFFLVPSVYEL